MQITQAGQPGCGIKCIYELIGKEPFTATNLKDLKDAAEKLGFSAEGYKLTLRQLTKTKGYAILPVGTATGTVDDPLHFILVKRIVKNYAITVNTRNLSSQAMPISDLQDCWNGYALVITAGKGMNPLRKEPDNIKQLPKRVRTARYDAIKDFGQVDSGAVVEHTFTIVTEKDKDHKAKIVQKSCSCLNARLGKDTKGQNTLTLELHVDSPAWQASHAVVLLEPGGIIRRYAMRAYGKDTFEIWPTIAHIEAPEGGLIEYPVKIHYYTGSDDVVEFNRMTSTLENVKCRPVISKSSTKKGTTTFSFEIPLLFDAGEPPGRVESVRGNVDFVLDTGKGQRDIPMSLTAQIGAERYLLTPETVFMMGAKSNPSPMHKSVKLQFLRGPIPTSITARADPSLPIKVRTTSVNARTYRIVMTVEPEKLQGLSTGSNRGEIAIVTEAAPEPSTLKLPITLFVRE
jgi:predicted double-glycine peptidase